MRDYSEMIGHKYSMLTITGVEKRGNRIYFVCVCDCGKVHSVRDDILKSGRTRSCGCYAKANAKNTSKTHGDSGTRLYSIWRNMKHRILNKNDDRYDDYGGRGITLCSDWVRYEGFRAWAMASGYDDSLSIDRIDNDGNYEPSNCRWADAKTQMRNRKVTKYVLIDNESYCFAELCEKSGKSYDTVRTRLRRGWELKDALERPLVFKRAVSEGVN